MSDKDSADTISEVFISVGRCCCPEQEQIVQRIFDFVRKSGLRPLSSRHGDDWPTSGPVEALREVMRRVSGTIIIAFERKLIERGTELRSGKLKDELLPTVWNQVEAGMACTAEHPILILMDRSIRKEGLLDRNFPWHVEAVDLSTFNPNEEAFSRLFSNFRKQVKQFQQEKLTKKPRRRNDKETIGELLGSLTPMQVKLVGGGLITTISGIATAAFMIGRYFAK